MKHPNLYLFFWFGVVKLFEELDLHGVTDFVILGGEKVKEGSEDPLAKDNNDQVEGEDDDRDPVIAKGQ